MNDVCIIGLGYVGLTLAAALAEVGYRVVGVERRADVRSSIMSGRAHFSEKGLDAVLEKHVAAGTIECHASIPSRSSIDTYMVTVGTPLTPEGDVNLGALEEVAKDVSTVAKNGDLVILRSTVRVGTTRSISKAYFENDGTTVHVAFCPERTLEGKALLELTTLPQIVSGKTTEAKLRAEQFFVRLSPKTVLVESLEAAELIKLINNTQRDLMFAFSNEVAEMCDAFGVSAKHVIASACVDYPRSNIPLPGPVGGPCLEKDPHILAESLREVDYVPSISLAGRRLNEDLPRYSISRISRILQSRGVDDLGTGTVVILGLAFKGRPETSDTRGTMARHILEAARARWPLANYRAYDAVVPASEFEDFRVDRADTLEAAFDNAAIVLIQNNHPLFAGMQLGKLMERMALGGIVYDFWSLFDDQPTSKNGALYTGLGNAKSAVAA